MEIYVDESGTFVPSGQPDSWNVCAALAVAEQAKPRIKAAIRDLKRAAGVSPSDEVKLDRVSEPSLLKFLGLLNDPGVVLFVSAVDSGLASSDELRAHQASQVSAIRANIPRMLYPQGKASVEELAARVERLSPQLYAQLTVHMDVIHRFLRHGLAYYAQWWPATLGRFSWHIDQKGNQPSTYETVAKHLTPALLQTRSMRDPMIMLEGANYAYLKPFEYTAENFPNYLRQEMPDQRAEGLNLGKLLTSDFQFVDSATSRGVQAVDILASSIRRCLRERFSLGSLPAISAALGRLMLQEAHHEPPIHLLTLSRTQRNLTGIPLKVAQTMRVTSKRMLRGS